ncbi:hypothetical protein OG948_36930 (plasmid) [Embleya sp. NBC_00888]|uniref:hypothetical protein n=1 Tax=Embleya sp. NBC_00888 TaxID=2975960 RepID=UPI002F909784|nr:hypothetical protein OG948_36930 [Embleya sp. NBC_00888]
MDFGAGAAYCGAGDVVVGGVPDGLYEVQVAQGAEGLVAAGEGFLGLVAGAAPSVVDGGVQDGDGAFVEAVPAGDRFESEPRARSGFEARPDLPGPDVMGGQAEPGSRSARRVVVATIRPGRSAARRSTRGR